MQTEMRSGLLIPWARGRVRPSEAEQREVSLRQLEWLQSAAQRTMLRLMSATSRPSLAGTLSSMLRIQRMGGMRERFQ